MCFAGCWYHHHNCDAKNLTNAEPEQVQARLKFDELKRAYIESLGYNVEYMHECTWRAYLRAHPEVLQRIKDAQLLKYEGPAWQQEGLKKDQIEDLVKQEKLYGFLCVDIRIPNKQLFDRCRDFSPFFKHAEVSRDDVGDHMRHFAEEKDLLKKPQKCLIGAMSADNFWVGTPLLKWYLDMGFEITKIHEVIIIIINQISNISN